MVNSNPETVSTDYDTSDRLYFEPLDEESVRDVIENEGGGHGSNGDSTDTVLPPAMVQFGGQTAINLSQSLDIAGLPIMGSSASAIDMATDRGRFEELAARNGIPQPPGGTARTAEQALQVAGNIGYPVLVRPSYVLGGRAMEIIQTPTELVRYFEGSEAVSRQQAILVDRYLEGVEVELDAVCDGEDVIIPGIMQHVERAGVHSGDSLAVYPALSLSEDEIETLVDYTGRIGRALGLRGLMNIQFVITGGGGYRNLVSGPVARTSAESAPKNGQTSRVYVLEVNPRSSRTIPFISKVTRVPMVKLAVEVMRGRSIREQGYEPGLAPRRDLVAVKAPVFSMSKLAGVDTFLGPEMKSTGEVMGIDRNYESAVVKALMASGLSLNPGASVLLSVADGDKADAIPLVRELARSGSRMYATAGTAAMIRTLGYEVIEVDRRLSGKHPTVVDLIQDGSVSSVVNTITGDRQTLQDGFHIRRAATERRIPCFTSLDTARCAVESARRNGDGFNVLRMAEYLDGSARK